MKNCDNEEDKMISSDDQQVNCLSSSDYSTLIHTNQPKNTTRANKSSRISFLNSALQSVRTINRSTNKGECRKTCKKNCKSECKTGIDKFCLTTSIYLEEHKGMDWRLQQLGYQLPEQDERLLADPHLSNELKFLRTQQKLCSVPVKLYISNNNNATTNNETNQHNSSVQLNGEQPVSVNSEPNESIFCNRCEQVINKTTYCVQADLSSPNFILTTKTNTNQQNTNSAGVVQSSTPVHVYFHIDCLQCTTCSEILVDFRAFLDPRTKIDDLNDEKIKLSIYCSRHFLELFKPRCELCEELIFDKKCTQAEGK